MVRRAAIVALLAPLVAAGCAQTLDFSECKVDSDCAKYAPAGGHSYCTSDNLCVNAVPTERLCPETIGMPGPNELEIASLMDRNNPLDIATEQAIRLATDEINMQQPGAQQPTLVVHLCDTASDPDQTLEVAKFAQSQWHLAAILGPSTSAGVIKITPFIVQNGILVMSPSATAIEISSLVDSDLVWRTAPSDVLQAQLLAQRVQMNVPTKVDTLYVNTVYGKGLNDSFVTDFQKIGAVPVSSEYVFMQGGSDLSQALNGLSRDAPSDALLVADVEAPLLVHMLGDMSFSGIKTTNFFMTDAAETDAIFNYNGMPADPTVLARITGTAPSHPNSPTYTTFANAYKSRFNQSPDTVSFAATGYDAVYLIAIAAAATKGQLPTGPDLARGLRKIVESSTPISISGPTYTMALNQMITKGMVSLEGASGVLAFDANGDPKYGTYEIWSIDTTNPMKPVFKHMTQ